MMVNTPSFTPEKVVRTWGETQKVSFFTNIWSLPQIYRNMVSQGISSKKIDKKWKFWSFFDKIGVRTYCFDDISSNMHYKGGKKCKILPFQNDYFDKNSLFGPYFAYFPLFPADMVILWVKAVNTISFAPEKVVRT